MHHDSRNLKPLAGLTTFQSLPHVSSKFEPENNHVNTNLQMYVHQYGYHKATTTSVSSAVHIIPVPALP
jgi:hypothetical protein